MGICQPADFDVEATMKECYIVDCESTDDCCGDRETEAPAKCRDRDIYCTSTIAGCDTIENDCISPSDCTGGSICQGTRTCAFRNTAICVDDSDCAETCEFPIGMGGAPTFGTCSIRGTQCSTDSDCSYATDTCSPGFCSCSNPNWDSSHPICSDPDCDDVCTLVCEGRRCVEDTSCESNADCGGVRDICADRGDCVQCETNADCDDPNDEEDNDDECSDDGSCFRPCQGDAECPMFHACEQGDCNYVGCRTTQECILLGTNAGIQDPRLLTCTQNDNGIGTCAIQCQIDAHCGGNQKCEDGSCKYIGCAEDTDCYSLLNLNNWVRDDFTPWVPEAVCMEPPGPAAE
jgi:hypothetical protein